MTDNDLLFGRLRAREEARATTWFYRVVFTRRAGRGALVWPPQSAPLGEPYRYPVPCGCPECRQ